MPLAQKVTDANCPACHSSDAWMHTKAGESRERLECDDCNAEWSR